MNKPDIFTVQKRIRYFSTKRKLEHLGALIKADKQPHSFRRAQLIALAKQIRTAAIKDCNEFDEANKTEQDNRRSA